MFFNFFFLKNKKMSGDESSTKRQKVEESWDAIARARMLGASDFPEQKLDTALKHVSEKILNCSSSPMTWELIFVGSGRFLIPELTLVKKMIEGRIRIKKVYFVDMLYFQDFHRAVVHDIVTNTIVKFSRDIEFDVTHKFPSGNTWMYNARLVIAFSYLTTWANTLPNISHFLADNWKYVMQHCQDEKLAFIDLFFHVNRCTKQLIIDDFSDLTQPPLTSEKYVQEYGFRSPVTFQQLWKEYVQSRIHPDLRPGVEDILPEQTYSQYCAQYSLITANDARDQAKLLCKLCGREISI
jgi:hypothetical protein